MQRSDVKSRSLLAGTLLGVTLVFLPFQETLNAQLPGENDTLMIREVVITRKQIGSEQPGFKFYPVDSSLIRNYAHYSLNDLLREATPLFIKEYAPGMAATSSFRGTSAGHTQVAWNGININDPMLGQTDFSLIPTAMIDNVMVSFGGASMDLGSGAIGGIINLGTEPDWDSRFSLEASPGTGSFGRHQAIARVSAGTDRFQSVTKAYLSEASNDFKYTDYNAPDPVEKNREHNYALSRSLMQELYFRKGTDVLSARVWYQDASRDLPGSTLWGYSSEKQSDNYLRSLISYDAVREKSEFFATAAWMHSNMHYRSSYDTTENIVSTLVVKSGLNLHLKGSTQLKFVLNNELNNAAADSYAENILHNNASLTISAEKKKGKWLGAALLVRETLNDRTFLLPDFSAGVELRTIPGKEHYVKMNVSRNSRIPSLNDRFWVPGGNPDLKNEYAWAIEAGYRMEYKKGTTLSAYSELNYFNNHIRNMIRWLPDESFVWNAYNAGKVNTSGIELSSGGKYRLQRFTADIAGSYSFTRARDISTSSDNDSQMPYIPGHQARASLALGYGNIYTSFSTSYSGMIFEDTGNADRLKDYTLTSVTGGLRLNLGRNSADLKLRIDNLFNVSYETIRYYPQPGRSYFLSLLLKFRS
ncbi:MAG: TonB-dependent receptor [Bacteroidales bacterium]|nr:TonB-dependent receptor [Bacteroidales bacterium]